MDEINARRLEREEGKKEGLVEGKAIGVTDATNAIALNMISMNLSDEQIQQAAGLSIKEIYALKDLK